MLIRVFGWDFPGASPGRPVQVGASMGIPLGHWVAFAWGLDSRTTVSLLTVDVIWRECGRTGRQRYPGDSPGFGSGGITGWCCRSVLDRLAQDLVCWDLRRDFPWPSGSGLGVPPGFPHPVSCLVGSTFFLDHILVFPRDLPPAGAFKLCLSVVLLLGVPQ